ncbi:MAG: hypothetical protein H7Y15_19260 [Pseudonocardia sp.]|nr:hypothetical protein [Pseudonocardia sp.]
MEGVGLSGSGSNGDRAKPPSESHLTKLLIFMVALPSILAVSLGVQWVGDRVAGVTEASRVQQILVVQRHLAELLRVVAVERQLVTGFRLDPSGDRAQLAVTLTESERLSGSVSSLLGDVDTWSREPISADFAVTVDELSAARVAGDADADPATTLRVIADYNAITVQLRELYAALIPRSGIDGDLTDLQLLGDLGNAYDEVAAQLVLMDVGSAPEAGIRIDRELQVSEGRVMVAMGSLLPSGGAEARLTGTESTLRRLDVVRAQLVRDFVAGTDRSELSLERVSGLLTGLGEEQERQHSEQAEQAAIARNGAFVLLGTSVALLSGALLAGLLLLFMVVRQVRGYLRRLLMRIAHLADVHRRAVSGGSSGIGHLPTPLASGAHPDGGSASRRRGGEIQDLHSAIDRLQMQLAQLPADQSKAASRDGPAIALTARGHALVNRQLELLEQFQVDELDGSRLANYFALDHLATQARRNLESALALAGGRERRPAQDEASATSIVSLIQAAISESAQYERISVAPSADIEPAAIAGSVASDLRHLLAELLDMVIRHPCTDEIVLSLNWAADSSIVVSVHGGGIVMTPDQLQRALKRVRSGQTLHLEAEDDVGTFLVAFLASRHGSTIEIAPGTRLDDFGAHLPSQPAEIPDSIARLIVPPILVNWASMPRAG